MEATAALIRGNRNWCFSGGWGLSRLHCSVRSVIKITAFSLKPFHLRLRYCAQKELCHFHYFSSF